MHRNKSSFSKWTPPSPVPLVAPEVNEPTIGQEWLAVLVAEIFFSQSPEDTIVIESQGLASTSVCCVRSPFK